MKPFQKHHFQLRNMHCDCCIRLLKLEMERYGISVLEAELGEVVLAADRNHYDRKAISDLLSGIGFEAIENKEEQLVEDIKHSVIDLVYHSTYNAMVRNSDFLVGRFNKSYQYLSAVFSRHENMTLEKFIIRQRILKAMELIQDGDMNLSEIAFVMGYSSVQYLSNQFKDLVGVSVTDFKKDMAGIRTAFVKSLKEDNPIQ